MTCFWGSDVNYIVMQPWKRYSGSHGISIWKFGFKSVRMYANLFFIRMGIHKVSPAFQLSHIGLVFSFPICYLSSILTVWDCFISIEALEPFLFRWTMEFLVRACACGLAFCKSVISPGCIEISDSPGLGCTSLKPFLSSCFSFLEHALYQLKCSCLSSQSQGCCAA